jgi:hypothetical protein
LTISNYKLLYFCKSFPLTRGLDGEVDETLIDARIYDPAFLLTLFAQILLPEVFLQPWLFTRNALPITLMALSSEQEEVRKLALVNLSRLYFHYEAGK